MSGFYAQWNIFRLAHKLLSKFVKFDAPLKDWPSYNYRPPLYTDHPEKTLQRLQQAFM